MPEQVVAERYRLVRRIGEGGMGEVWEALHTAVDKTMALKFLHGDLLRHPRPGVGSWARRRLWASSPIPMW